MRVIIKELRKKYKEAIKDIKDIEKENEGNKGELLETIRN